ncbi:MAG: MATE family efflux transporter [Moorea sp. SIO3G5]|nr:MATE family efflux transporter [Moorena sp. SIO3G5]
MYSTAMESLLARFYRLAAVNILSNIMVPLASLVDVAFLGHLSDISYLAGVSLAAILFSYLYRLLNFLRLGTTGVTAQAVGQDDHKEVLLLLLRNGLIALGLGLIILILQYPLREIGFFILSASPDVKLAGIDYFNARIWGAPAVVVNLVLIIRWGWNSAGAGLASGLSQYVALLFGLVFFLGEVDWQQLSAAIPKLKESSGFKAAFVLNGNILIRTVAIMSTLALFTELSAILGTVVLAENSILLQIILFTIFFFEGIGFATESLSGYFKGKNNNDSLLALVRISVGISLVVGITLASACNLFPETLFGLLTNHAEVIAPLKVYDRWLFVVLVSSSIAFMLDGYFIGLAEGSIVRNVAVAAALLVFVPVAAIAWYFHNNHILWLALSSFILSRAIMLLIQLPKTFVTDSCTT